MDTKHADFAGSWYPGTAHACERDILDFLADPLIRSVPGREYRAGIVPHAGWFFSGALACHVFKTLRGKRKPDVIVLFGKHLGPRDPATIMVKGGLETPFGIIGIHEPLALALADTLNLTIEMASEAPPENTLELQLPFVRYFFPDVPVIPLGVPPTALAETLGREVVRLSRDMGLTIKAIGSTDLTHYGPNYGFSPAGTGKKGVAWVKEENDKRMVNHLVAMNEKEILKEALTAYNACCGGAAAAVVAAAKAMGADKGELLGYTTSYDKRPDDSLVGYVGMVF
ncbi:MAG: AmmeMemoRadiSam system protein B [Proteobacteria bacterium]|nr:AmmeMemoRadiSam system protein B [Pseudomonadota bacterium]